jgi:hypothetical protein
LEKPCQRTPYFGRMGRDYVSATGNACLFPLWLRPFGLSGPAKQPNRYSLHGSSQAEPSGTARPQPTPLVLPEPTTMMRDTTRAPRAKCGRNGNQHKRQPALYIHASRATLHPPITEAQNPERAEYATLFSSEPTVPHQATTTAVLRREEPRRHSLHGTASAAGASARTAGGH